MGAIKSKTLWFAYLLAGLSAVQANLPQLADTLKQHQGITYVAIAVAIAVLRVVTTQPLSEK